MPNNPATRRAGAIRVPAANKIQRGPGQTVASTPTSSSDVPDTASFPSGGGGGGAVTSVNGNTGVVVLNYASVGADAAGAASAAQTAAASDATTKANAAQSAAATDATTKANAAQAAAIAAAATDATTKANAAQAAAIAASLQKASNLSDVASKRTSKQNLNLLSVNVRDFGATGDGVTDDRNAIISAIEACCPSTGVDRIVMRAFGTGYTSAPAVSITGGAGTGFAATALVADTGANGEIGTVVISTRGTGYVVKGKQCDITSGSAVLACSDTSGLSVGMAADCEPLAAGSVISSISANVSVTLSANATATRPFAQVAFGIPRVVFTGGGGSGASADCIMGDGATLKFPPGTYHVNNGFDITAKHNLVVDAIGAKLHVNSTGSSGFVVDNFCRDITFFGIKVEHVSAVFGNSATRGVGCGWRISGDLINLIDCEAYSSPEFGFLLGRTNVGVTCYGGRFINCKAIQTCGDGFHIGSGCSGADLINPTCMGTGDDAIGIVSDYGTGNEVSNVNVHGYNIQGGGWRGIAILGAKNIRIGPGFINGVESYGIQIADISGAVCSDVTLQGFHLQNIGSLGAGEPVSSRNALAVQYLTGGRIGPGYINTCTGWGLSIYDCTDVHVDEFPILNASSGKVEIGSGNTRLSYPWQEMESLGTATTFTGSLNTDLDCQGANNFASMDLPVGRWFVEGSITLRFDTGAGSGSESMWPRIWDGTTEYGGGAVFQSNNSGDRIPCYASAFITVESGTKTVRFKVKQSGGGVKIDAGSVFGYNSVLRAHRI